MGDVRNLLGIGRISLEVALQMILDTHRALPGWLLAPTWLLWDTLDAAEPHQTCHPAHAAGFTLMAQVIADTWCT